MISVVCPFYNEAAIIASSVRTMVDTLRLLDEPWELIVVDDGSTDDSRAIVQRLAAEESRVSVLGYRENRGRGFALRTGMQAARGHLVVTTEIDLSWGDDIVARILKVFRENPELDMVIASPHLHGGGYRNVPRRRIFLSTAGNVIIRAGLNRRITMNTGMTRGYRRESLLRLPLTANGKELHLEIVNKALAFNYRIQEIPAVIEWKARRRERASRPGRRVPSSIPTTIHTHLFFSLLASPFRYLSVISGLLGLAALAFEGWAFYRLMFTHEVAIFLAISGFFLGLFAIVVFAVGVLASQNTALQRELWTIQAALREPDEARERDARTRRLPTP